MDEPGLDMRRAGPLFPSASHGLMADLWRARCNPICSSITRFRAAREAFVIYAEYIEHDRTLPIQIFQHIGRQSGWVSDVDVKIGNLGRAERIGPEPSVICLW